MATLAPATDTTREALLEIQHVSKTFPGVKALDDVSLRVEAGEIVALVGQNGSGKSTLVKVMAGVHAPDPGGRVSLARGTASEQAELHFIHQDLALVSSLSTVENLELTRPLGCRALSAPSARRERLAAEKLIARFGASFDVRCPVAKLSAAERALVAIARALSGWTHPRNVLVLDEPTVSLHGTEVAGLFTAVRRVADEGAGVLFISHRLDEVLELADRVVALRDGRLVGNARRGEFGHDDLVRLIAGGSKPLAARRERPVGDGARLRARGICGGTIESLDLDVDAGEVVGISGVLGSGRERVAGVLFGASAGEVRELVVDGRSLSRRTPKAAIDAGLGYVPADRHRNGAVMTISARENLTLPRLQPLTGWFGRLDSSAERAEVAGWIRAVAVRPADGERQLALFSGGNQQKIVLAKWLRVTPKVLLLEDPTQGVDIGARAAIFELIGHAAAEGTAVLICSCDAKELTLICDRVVVMRDGRAVADIPRRDLSEEAVVQAGLGPARVQTADHPSQGAP
jgi:ABC-type sugar transport system ATPase subunit